MRPATIIVIASCSALARALPQEHADSRARRLESICSTEVAAPSLRSIAARVSLGDEVLLQRSFVAAAGDEHLVERIDAERGSASAFEPLIGFAIARLVAQDRLALDGRVATMLPQFADWQHPVTLLELLTHTSGIASYRDYVRVHEELSRDALLAWIAVQPLGAPPGTCFEYSESNVLLAAAIVERATGLDVEHALAKLVVEPAGIEGLAWMPLDSRTRDAVALDLAGERLAVEPAYARLGLGTPTATLADLARLASSLWNTGALDSGGIELVSATRRLPDRSEIPMGWGWSRTRLAQRAACAFGGRTARSVVHVLAVPDVELIVAVASQNSEDSLEPLARRLARAVLDEPEPQVLDLELPEDLRAACAGVYYIGCARIAIEARNGALWFLPPADDAFRLRFQGAQSFVSAADADVRVEFEVRDGQALGFVLDLHGSRTYARRVE